MKALVYEGPKKLAIKEVPVVPPKENEVILKVRSCGICGSDTHGYLGLTGRRIEPMIMGHEFSGEVYQLGSDSITSVKVGDKVTVQPLNFCGKCIHCKEGFTNLCLNKKFFGVLDVNGAMAEYITVPEELLFKIPDEMSFDYAALTEPVAVAYCGLKKAGDIKDKNVLIIGAGTIGLLTLLCAQPFEPASIVMSDLSDFRLNVALELGANDVINAKTQLFPERVDELTNNLKFDIVIEAVGAETTVNQANDAVKANGTIVWIGNNIPEVTLNMQEVVTNALTIKGTYIYTQKEFGEALEFIKNKKLDFSKIISKRVSIQDAPEAFCNLAESADEYLKIVIAFDD